MRMTELSGIGLRYRGRISGAVGWTHLAASHNED